MHRRQTFFFLILMAFSCQGLYAQPGMPGNDSLRIQLQLLRETREQMVLKTSELEVRRLELSSQLEKLQLEKMQLDSNYNRICEQLSGAEKSRPANSPVVQTFQHLKAETIGEMGNLDKAIRLITNRNNKTSRMLESAREIMTRLNERLAGLEAKLAQ